MTRSRVQSTLIKETLKSAERKGGGFLLSMIYLLDPIDIPTHIEKAIFTAGSWGQLIDDYADLQKDKKSSIFTIYTVSTDPTSTFKELSREYENKIMTLTHNENFLIPVMRDLVWLAELSRLPFISNIFRMLNE
jgi:hypothetical protein